MVELFYPRGWEKRNGTDFSGVILLMYTIWEYWNILTHEGLIQFLFSHFRVLKYILKKYLKRKCLIQNVISLELNI